MIQFRLPPCSVVSALVGVLALVGCAAPTGSTVETTELSSPPSLTEVPVFAITWNGAPGSKLATVGVLLDNGEFRTAFHSTEMVGGSGLFFGTNLKAYLEGTPATWKTVAGGKYPLNRSLGEDWVQLSIQPKIDAAGWPFDFQTPLEPGKRLYVVGFDAPKQAINENMRMTAAKQTRTGVVVEPPKDQVESGADLRGIVFAAIDPPGLRPGWSGSPVLAEISGKLVVIGTAIDVNAPRKFGSASEIDWDSQYYTIINRNGPN